MNVTIMRNGTWHDFFPHFVSGDTANFWSDCGNDSAPTKELPFNSVTAGVGTSGLCSEKGKVGFLQNLTGKFWAYIGRKNNVVCYTVPEDLRYPNEGGIRCPNFKTGGSGSG